MQLWEIRRVARKAIFRALARVFAPDVADWNRAIAEYEPYALRKELERARKAKSGVSPEEAMARVERWVKEDRQQTIRLAGQND